VSTYAIRRGYSLGWWGMAMFVASETALFAMLTGSYFYLRFKNLAWPPPGIPEPKTVVPAILLVVLLLSIVPVLAAYRRLQTGAVASAWWLILAAAVVQAGYVAMQIHLLQDDLRHFTPQTHAYGSIYFVLLGADHAHVLLGVVFDVWLFGKLLRGLTPYRLNALQAISLYWVAVGAITTVVTLTIMSPAL
jgi:heme/copper-type cytochrome/quinol oxidase subunit 3